MHQYDRPTKRASEFKQVGSSKFRIRKCSSEHTMHQSTIDGVTEGNKSNYGTTTIVSFTSHN
jgi:hypothetical protein